MHTLEIYILSLINILSYQGKIIPEFSEGKIQGISINMSLDTAKKLLSRDFFIKENNHQIDEDGDTPPTDYEVFLDDSMNELLFSFNGGRDYINKDRIFRILIFSPKYVANTGLSVGNTLSEIKNGNEIGEFRFSYDWGLFLHINNIKGGVLFDLKSTKTDFNYEEPSINNVPDDIKIENIVLF
jgi:hypothetical protein